MEAIDLYTALKITNTFDEKEIYVKRSEDDQQIKAIPTEEIKAKWDMHATKVSGIGNYWDQVSFEYYGFVFTIEKQINKGEK